MPQSRLLCVLLTVLCYLLLISPTILFAQNLRHIPDDATASRMLDTYFRDCHRRQQFNGTVLVRRKGKTLYRKGFGLANTEWGLPNRPEGCFEIGSMTKQFAGVLALILRDEGKLDFQSPISRYLPELRDTEAGKVTPEQLLTHTAGIPGNILIWDRANNMSQPYSSEFVIEAAKTWKPEFAPGTKWAYSNTGFLLSRAVLEAAGGQPIATLLQQRIFTPLGLKRTGVMSLATTVPYRVEGYERNFENVLQHSPRINMEWALMAAGLYSSADDLARWAESLNSGKLLLPQSQRDLFTAHANDTYSYGLGVRQVTLENPRQTFKVFGHTGRFGGFHTNITWTDEGTTIVVLNNTDIESDVAELAKEVRHMLSGEPYRTPPASLSRQMARIAATKGWAAALEEMKSQGTNKQYYTFEETEVNDLGYYLMQHGDIRGAIAVFTFNTEQFPRSANAFDSLGEAYTKEGNAVRAIACYEKTLELAPGSENARQMLERLKKSVGKPAPAGGRR